MEKAAFEERGKPLTVTHEEATRTFLTRDFTKGLSVWTQLVRRDHMSLSPTLNFTIICLFKCY